MGFTLRFLIGSALVAIICTPSATTSSWRRYRREISSTESHPLLNLTTEEALGHYEIQKIKVNNLSRPQNEDEATERKPKTEKWNTNDVLNNDRKPNVNKIVERNNVFTTESSRIRTKLIKSEPYTRHRNDEDNYRDVEGSTKSHNSSSSNYDSEKSPDYDIGKYTSPEFKNKVYSISASSDDDDFFHHKFSTYHDDEDEDDFSHHYGPTSEYSVPKYFDFDDDHMFDKTTEPDFPKPKEGYETDVAKFMNMGMGMEKSNDTDKKIDIDFLTFKKVETNDKKNKNTIRKNFVSEKRTSLDYNSSIIKTKTIDDEKVVDKDNDNTQEKPDYSENASEIEDNVTENTQITDERVTEKPHVDYDTTKKNMILRKVSSFDRNNSHIPIFNNTIEMDAFKSTEATVTEQQSVDKSNKIEQITASNNLNVNSSTEKSNDKQNFLNIPVATENIFTTTRYDNRSEDRNAETINASSTDAPEQSRKTEESSKSLITSTTFPKDNEILQDVISSTKKVFEESTRSTEDNLKVTGNSTENLKDQNREDATSFKTPTNDVTTESSAISASTELLQLETTTNIITPTTNIQNESQISGTGSNNNNNVPITTSTDRNEKQLRGEKERIDNIITKMTPITVTKRGSTKPMVTTESTRYKSTYVSRRISDTTRKAVVSDNVSEANKAASVVQGNIDIVPSETVGTNASLPPIESTDQFPEMNSTTTEAQIEEETSKPINSQPEEVSNMPIEIEKTTEETITEYMEKPTESLEDKEASIKATSEENNTTPSAIYEETSSGTTEEVTNTQTNPETEYNITSSTQLEIAVTSSSVSTSQKVSEEISSTEENYDHTNSSVVESSSAFKLNESLPSSTENGINKETDEIDYDEGEDEDGKPEVKPTEGVFGQDDMDVEHKSPVPDLIKPEEHYPTSEIDKNIDLDSETTVSPEVTTNPEHLKPDEGGNKGKIAAITISCVGALCLIILAVLLVLMRKRQKHFNNRQRCTPVSLDSYSMDNVSVTNSVRRKGLRSSKRSFGNPAFDDPSSVTHPLNFLALAKFATNLEDIKSEFEEIPQITARMTELPEGCDVKNRYANVIPLPETRVILNSVEGVPNSDYINANYVTGPKATRGYYIACQAPMQNTVDDFWRMIWEQQSKVILMLTHLFENGIEKSFDYLPPSEVTDCHRLFGDYQVTLKKREVKDKYIISNLQLKNMVSNSWRELTHFWYLGWPDKGVPAEANSLIAFLIEARSCIKNPSIENNIKMNGNKNVPNQEVSPIVVHCSPGTGRTGTMIACDIAIREFEISRQVDIPRIVYKIRRDRASAVQTKEQYLFIYKVISLYATKLTGGALDSL